MVNLTKNQQQIADANILRLLRQSTAEVRLMAGARYIVLNDVRFGGPLVRVWPCACGQPC